ncbi:MAG: Gfo/Idh/MocA family oxidoreductase [Verrucomicrobiota bacterium]
MSPPSSTPTRASVRIGVIGTGYRISTVLRALRENAPNIAITAVCDPDADARAAFHRALAPEAVDCAEPESLCQRADVDWVFVGSWNCHHAAHAIAAFQAGKHVFCEKPLALSHAEAVAMHAAWRASGCSFAYGLVLRYSPLYRKVHDLLRTGAIGQLLSFEFNETLVFNHGGLIHGNWRRHRALAGTHALEKCCHDIDLAHWFAGSLPVRLASFGGCSFFRAENAFHAERIGPSPEGKPPFRSLHSNPRGISPFNDDKSIVDHQVAILEFANGVRASFHTQCLAAIPERRFYLLGSEGTLRVDAYTGRIETRHIGWDEPLVVHEPVASDLHAGGDRMMAGELADALNGLRAPATGFTEGILSLTTVLALDAALDQGTVVDLRPRWLEVARQFGDPQAAAAAAVNGQAPGAAHLEASRQATAPSPA